ncbi:MAG: TrkH family potassium uptake protein [Pseudomonadota bacterium]
MSTRARPARTGLIQSFQPVVHVIGRLTAALGVSMLIPALLAFSDGDPGWSGFLIAALISLCAGAALAIITVRDRPAGLNRQQAVLLTVLVWVALPIFGALPFVLSAPYAGYTNAFFEAMSGLTTTGATVFSDLAEAPRGMLLWRAMLQWFGGVGIVVVAMVFLPTLKIGGMQFFRSESFDLIGDILPRAAEAAGQISGVYVGLTVACVMAYAAAGMSTFDAICHAMTTISTGGLGNYDDSFASFPAMAQYAAVVFMALAAMPFLRLMQVTRGQTLPLWRDAQVRGFLGIIAVVGAMLALWQILVSEEAIEPAIRAALFNTTAILTGTGYASDDFSAWGGFPMALFFILALIGGCAGSTSCSAKVFRYQILIAALRIQLRRIHAPHGVHPLRYAGRPVEAEVLSSVMGFFFIFAASLATWAAMLSLTGLDTVTSISGAVAALANVGPGLGDTIGPAGNYQSLPDSAKWILAMGMLLGRLEFMSVLVLLAPAFWAR